MVPASPSSSSSRGSSVLSPPKKVVFFPLENVLIPGDVISTVSVSDSKRFLKSFSSFASKNNIHSYVISALPLEWARQKVVEHKLDSFFSSDAVFGVDQSYLDRMEPIDRARYDSKKKDNPNCSDEYFRQVAMLDIMKKNHYNANQCLLLGNDFWFDGFYTRRYAQVDVVFIEPSLTTRGKPVLQKISGLWYAPLSFKLLKKFLDGKHSPPNYKPLDTWASVTLTEALLGAQNFNMVKRVILEKKKDGTLHHVSTSGSVSPHSQNNDEMNPPFA